MSSAAFRSLDTALKEVAELGTLVRPYLNKTTGLALSRLRVVGRAQVVLLSSHFERYFYGVNEEAVMFVNSRNITAADLSDPIKLLHSKQPIDDIAETGWENRSKQLSAFHSTDGWLWSPGLIGNLSHERLLAWMTAPKPPDIVRYYRYWGMTDIFGLVTRKATSRGQLWLGIQELVDKRNSIAHGDFSAQVTQADIRRYADSVHTFCQRADRQFARAVAKLVGSAPW
jgi:hypothetical protein